MGIIVTHTSSSILMVIWIKDFRKAQDLDYKIWGRFHVTRVDHLQPQLVPPQLMNKVIAYFRSTQLINNTHSILMSFYSSSLLKKMRHILIVIYNNNTVETI